MDLVTLHSYWTVLVLVVFVYIVYWAFTGKHRQYFEEQGRIPFDDDSVDMNKSTPKEQKHG